MSGDEAPRKATQIRGIWVFALACLIFTAFVAVNAYIVPAPELQRHSLAGRMLLRTADVIGVFVLSMAIGLAVSFFISALLKELRSPNTTAFWLTAIGVALIPIAVSVMSTWNAVSHDRAAVIADTPVQLKEREERALVKEMVEVRNRLSKNALAHQSQFVAEVEKLDVPTMLTADTLVSRSGIARNKAKLAQLALLVDRQASLSRSNMLELQRQITEVISGHPRGPEFRRSFDSTSKARADLESKIIDNQRKFISVVSNLNDFMSARLGRVASQGGIIRFETEDEAKTYNAYVQRALKLATHEADLLVQLQDMVEKGTKTLDQLTR